MPSKPPIQETVNVPDAIELARCYLTGGNSPLLHVDTTVRLARALLALDAFVPLEQRKLVDELAAVTVEKANWRNQTVAALTERDRLATRVDELLVTIRNLSSSVPYEEEKNATATLIAEVGTLRSQLRAAVEIAKRQTAGEIARYVAGDYLDTIHESCLRTAIAKEILDKWGKAT